MTTEMNDNSGKQEESHAEGERLNKHQDVGRQPWLLALIRRTFRKSWDLASPECLQELCGTKNKEAMAGKLIRMFARNAALLGAMTGVLMSADEIIAFATGGEGGIGLPRVAQE